MNELTELFCRCPCRNFRRTQRFRARKRKVQEVRRDPIRKPMFRKNRSPARRIGHFFLFSLDLLLNLSLMNLDRALDPRLAYLCQSSRSFSEPCDEFT